MKRVYTFGDGKAEGNASMRNLLGGKGANLAEMNLLGMPVPPGFTITTEVCTEYTQYGRDEVVSRLEDEVKAAIAHVENLTGKKFNDPANPLLVSVRADVWRRGSRHEAQNQDRHRSFRGDHG